MNFIGDGCAEYLILMYRSLQLVVHLPIINVVFPSNVMIFLQCLINVVQFDIEKNFKFVQFLPFIVYDNN
jgi:hypothetical protein